MTEEKDMTEELKKETPEEAAAGRDIVIESDADGEGKSDQIKAAQDRLAVLQQKIKELSIPVVILFEGWGASGKGAIISKLINTLDPRSFKVYTIGEPNADELRRPLMWRYWNKIPEYGKMSVFDRSWYRDVSISRVEGEMTGGELDKRFREINEFEAQLTDDGYVLLKFFLSISKKEQRRRFTALEADRATKWRVTAADWKHHRDYDRYEEAFDEMRRRTNRDYAPWIVIDAKKRKDATLRVFEETISTLENRIALNSEPRPSADLLPIKTRPEITPLPIAPLDAYDLNVSYDEATYKDELKKAQKRLFELHNRLYQTRTPLIIVYEGWDAAGKGGNIRRLTQGLDPRGFEVNPVSAPTPQELHHHYLWRFWNSLPKNGHIAIYDRSWYGRVMVERIEGFCTTEQWKRAFDEMNRFEDSLREWGAIIVKFWMQIDKEEQLRRFEERMNTPEKRWKITDEDWRNREKWDEYVVSVNDMLKYTNTEYAPWIVIESNDKKYARIKTIQSVINQIEKHYEREGQNV